MDVNFYYYPIHGQYVPVLKQVGTTLVANAISTSVIVLACVFWVWKTRPAVAGHSELTFHNYDGTGMAQEVQVAHTAIENKGFHSNLTKLKARLHIPRTLITALQQSNATFLDWLGHYKTWGEAKKRRPTPFRHGAMEFLIVVGMLTTIIAMAAQALLPLALGAGYDAQLAMNGNATAMAVRVREAVESSMETIFARLGDNATSLPDTLPFVDGVGSLAHANRFHDLEGMVTIDQGAIEHRCVRQNTTVRRNKCDIQYSLYQNSESGALGVSLGSFYSSTNISLQASLDEHLSNAVDTSGAKYFAPLSFNYFCNSNALGHSKKGVFVMGGSDAHPFAACYGYSHQNTIYTIADAASARAYLIHNMPENDQWIIKGVTYGELTRDVFQREVKNRFPRETDWKFRDVSGCTIAGKAEFVNAPTTLSTEAEVTRVLAKCYHFHAFATSRNSDGSLNVYNIRTLPETNKADDLYFNYNKRTIWTWGMKRSPDTTSGIMEVSQFRIKFKVDTSGQFYSDRVDSSPSSPFIAGDDKVYELKTAARAQIEDRIREIARSHLPLWATSAMANNWNELNAIGRLRLEDDANTIRAGAVLVMGLFVVSVGVMQVLLRPRQPTVCFATMMQEIASKREGTECGASHTLEGFDFKLGVGVVRGMGHFGVVDKHDLSVQHVYGNHGKGVTDGEMES